MEKTQYKSSSEELEALRMEIGREFQDTMRGISNPFLVVLQSHLYFENLLERYIVSELPNGDVLIKEGRLSFYQKIMVVNSFGTVESEIIEALRKFNSLRNSLAHKFGHTIQKEQIESISVAMGKDYSEIQRVSEGCLAKEIELVGAYIAGCLGFMTHTSEKLERISHNKAV